MSCSCSYSTLPKESRYYLRNLIPNILCSYKTPSFNNEVTVTTTRKRGRWSSSSSVPLSLNQISPRVQFTQTLSSYILTVHLAGFKRDEIKLEMGKTKTIIVKAQRHVDGVGEMNWTWHIMDSDKSSSTPSKKPFQIPSTVDVSKISATFQDGVVTIVMPVIEDTQHAAISEDQQKKKTLDKDLGSDSGVVYDGDGEEKKQGLADGQERNKEIEQQQQQSTLSEREKEEENLGSSLSKDEPLYSSSSVLHEDVEKSKQCIEDEKEIPKEEKEDMEKQESAKDDAANENANTEREVEENKAKVLCDEEKQKQICDEEKLENEHNAFIEGKEASLPSSKMAMADDGKSIMEKCESDYRTPEDRTSFDFKRKEQLSLARIREGMNKNTRALVICGTIFTVGVLVACHRKLRRP